MDGVPLAVKKETRAVLSLIALAAALPATPMVGGFDCQGRAVTAVFHRDRLSLTIDGKSHVLREVPAASGTRHMGRGIEFRTKGREAMLIIGKRAPIACTMGDRAAFRALGQEPGWSMTIDGQVLKLSYDYGQKQLRGNIVAAKPSFEAREWVATAGRMRIVAIARNQTCQDSMSGTRYAQSVTVRFGNQTLKGCGGTEVAAATAMIEGGEWIVEDIGGGGIVDGSRVTIEVADGRIAGRATCNRYMGPFTRTGDAVSVGPLAGTKMACAPALMQQEDKFLRLLEQATSARIREDGALEIATSGGPIVARRGS